MSEKSVPEWHVDSPSSAEEWESAARSVGVTGPGAMQQARHMANAAVTALGFVYDETAPSDITEGIERLRSCEATLKAVREKGRTALQHLGQLIETLEAEETGETSNDTLLTDLQEIYNAHLYALQTGPVTRARSAEPPPAFNINETVRLTLTEAGSAVWLRDQQEIGLAADAVPERVITTTLYEAFTVFGPAMAGKLPVFEGGMIEFPDTAKALHAKSAHHREAVLSSDRCGCFSCLRIFSPNEITEWVARDANETAVCPHCSVDAVLPSSSVDLTPELLSTMQARWFRVRPR